MPKNYVSYKTYGPVFDGVAIEMTGKAVEAAETAIAARAVDVVKANLNANIKMHVTGAEPASFHPEKTSKFITRVTDNHDIAYGPWLEGTGSRNKTTRFKGYFSAKLAASEVNREAEAIAEAAVKPFVGKMN